MLLSEHFTLEEGTVSETAARQGIDNTPPASVLENMKTAAQGMEKVRQLLNAPILVSSWYRSPELNVAIGGSRTGAHPEGWAIDFRAPWFGSPLEVCKKIVASGMQFDQLIYEGTWVHLSFSPKMRQQVLTAHFRNGAPTTYTNGLPNA